MHETDSFLTPSDASSESLNKRFGGSRFAFAKRRAFAFAKRGRSFAFAKRTPEDKNYDTESWAIEPQHYETEKRAKFAFAKRSRSFAFA